MNRSLLACIALLTVTLPPSAGAEDPVSGGKVFLGPEGVRVEVVTLGAPADKKALVLVRGTGTEVDGIVLVHDYSDDGERVAYETQRHGRPFVTVWGRGSHGGARSYEVAAPGRRDGISIQYDEKATQSIKPMDVYALYTKQKGDGTLARIQAFDRPKETGEHDASFAKVLAEMNQACGSTVVATIDWTTVDDELLKHTSVSGYCENVLSALRGLCETNAAKKAIRAHVKSIQCRWGPAMKLERGAGESLTFMAASNGTNLEQFARDYLRKNIPAEGAPAAKVASGAMTPPWGSATTLGDRAALERTALCTDGKSHYVAIAPNEKSAEQLLYGDGKKFNQVREPAFGIGDTMFLDPRFVLKTANPNFRGSDIRIHSEVDYDAAKKTCVVRCGERKIPLQIVEAEKAEPLLLAASYAPPLPGFKPHALLRDDHGAYYLVDRGMDAADEKNFRVFIGQKGSMQEQKMTNIVADSEGEIFSTKRGELRLVVDKAKTSMWIDKKNRVELRMLPVPENLSLIYTDLGVYAGVRLGNPCDDL